MTVVSRPTLLIEVTAQDVALAPAPGDALPPPPDDGGHYSADGRSPVRAVLDRLAPVAVDTAAVVAAVSETLDSLAAAFRPRKGGPAGCEVKFGLKVSGSGNVILAKMGTEVTLEVKLTWNREDAQE